MSNDGVQRNTGFGPMFGINVTPTNSSSNFADKNFIIYGLFCICTKGVFRYFGPLNYESKWSIQVTRLTWLVDVVDASDADAQQRNRGQHTEYLWASRLVSVSHSGAPRHRERVGCDASLPCLQLPRGYSSWQRIVWCSVLSSLRREASRAQWSTCSFRRARNRGIIRRSNACSTK